MRKTLLATVATGALLAACSSHTHTVVVHHPAVVVRHHTTIVHQHTVIHRHTTIIHHTTLRTSRTRVSLRKH